MCLNTNQISSHKAKKDIECYKILVLEAYVDEEKDELVYKLQSPLYSDETDWEIGKVFKDNKFVSTPKGGKKTAVIGFSNKVQYGYHTYKHFRDILNVVGTTHSYKIFKAIIPEGSQYFSGWINGSHDIFGYVSEQLKLIKEIRLE